jgi:serine/threonine-protein kinase
VLDALLAQGGFGQVYRAHHATTGRVVAVKVLTAGLQRAGRGGALPPQAGSWCGSSTPTSSSWSRGAPSMTAARTAMEFLTGTDLGRALATRGRLPVADALAIVAPVASALAAAHAQAIVHRDVKAANVFLATDGAGGARPILIDFGIAKLAAPDAAELTTSRQLVGTPVTMAPEQIRGGAVDARTDVYGLGVMTFHLLTGRLPFEDESPTIVQYLHAHARRPGPRRSPRCRPRSTRSSRRRWRSSRTSATPARPSSPPRWPPPPPAIPPPPPRWRRAPRSACWSRSAPTTTRWPIRRRALGRSRGPVAAGRGAPHRRRLPGGAARHNLLLAARAIDGDDALARTGAIEVGRAVAAALEARPDRDPRVGFVCVVHAAVALCAGDQVRAGDLTDVAYWSPDPEVRGLVATRAALDGLPVVGAAVSDSRVWQVR